jgi:hypothetical protein
MDRTQPTRDELDRVLAHIRACQTGHPESPAMGLVGMTHEHFRECIAVLHAEGHDIVNCWVPASGDVAGGIGYWIGWPVDTTALDEMFPSCGHCGGSFWNGDGENGDVCGGCAAGLEAHDQPIPLGDVDTSDVTDPAPW